MQPIRALSVEPLTTLAEVARLSPEELQQRLSKAGRQPATDPQSLSVMTSQGMRKQMQVFGALFAEAK